LVLGHGREAEALTLTAPERERLRREIDRRKRARLGAKLSLDHAWLSIPEAASRVGIETARARAAGKRRFC
jgi:hypothetical protein